MNCKKLLRFLLLPLILAAGLTPLNAQWATETIQLTNGWNAVFLHVDASYTSISNLISTDTANPITQVWRWNPSLRTQTINTPSTPGATLDWLSWNRTNSSAATLQNLVGDSAYLVYLSVSSAATNLYNYTWTVKGQPAPPRHTWTVSGLNLIGFPVVSNNPPNFASFFGQSSTLQSVSPEVDYYVGGELVSGVNPKLLASALFSLNSVTRGKAYWMRSGAVFNNYFGPFEVTGTPVGGINFGASSGQSVFRLSNLTTNTLTITANLLPSDSAPSGQSAYTAVPPLLVKGALNPTNLTYGYSSIATNASYSWTLGPYGSSSSSVAVTLGLDRSAITNPQGTLLGGILNFTDSLGYMSVKVGVSASVGSLGGLWIGNASVTKVGEYLKTYPVVTNYISTGVAAAALAAGLSAPNSEQSGAAWVNAQAVPMINPSFQTDTPSVFPGYTSLTGWTATGLVGINPGTSGLVSYSPYADNGLIPDGKQVAFMQGTNILSQVVSNLQVGGLYQLHYFENAQATATNTTLLQGWKVKVAVATASSPLIGSIAQAESLLANTNSSIATVFSTNATVLNYNYPSGNAAQFTGDVNFPGLGTATTNWVLEATALISIPTNGTYSFDVNSDDGFRLTVGTNVAVYNAVTAAGDRITIFTNMVAGTYPVRLVYFNGNGNASLEVSAGFGTNTTYSASAFKLIGDTVNGGLAITNAGYLTEQVRIGSAAGVGQMIVPSHTVVPVAASGTSTMPYTEVWSLPFVASNSAMTLSFITSSNSPSDFGTVLLDAVGVSPVLANNYSAVASSADGSRLFVADAGNASTGGQIYVSSNYGQTWFSVATNNPSGTVTNQFWSALACSGSGSAVLAAANSGPLYLSTDYGSHWAIPYSLPSASVSAIANPSFEANTFVTGVGYANANGGVVSGWVLSNPANIGLNCAGTGTATVFADNGTTPKGNNVLFIQSAASISTTLSNLTAGVIYTVTFRANSRTSGAGSYPNASTCSVNGGAALPITASPPAGSNGYYTNSVSFIATNSTASLTVTSASTTGGDYSLLLDDFTVSTTDLWTGLSVSQDGAIMYGITSGGKILRSADGGVTWAATTPTSNITENWGALLQSASATNVIAIINDGRSYRSLDKGVSWMPLASSGRSTIAAAADAALNRLVTVSTNGQISVSQDGGSTFSSTPLILPRAKVACSLDGLHLVAAAPGSPIYTSEDGGSTWKNRSLASQWSGVASSGDGTRLAFISSPVGSTNAAIYTVNRKFNVYSVNSDSGLIMLPNSGSYLTSVNTNMGVVSTPYPLRLIIQNPTNGNPALLMQRVYVGVDAYTNGIISSGESALNSSLLAQARRISAVHLPWTPTNTLWSFNSALARGTNLSTTVTTYYNDRASNPFVHAYHPDHDNLNSTFTQLLPRGAESYDLQRQITLNFSGVSDDFAGRTGSATAVSGNYSETYTVLGLGSNTRTFQAVGYFQLNRMTDNPNLTVAP